MPEIDFAFVADYVRPEGGVVHAIAAGIDTVYAPVVPTGRNLALLIRLTFSRAEVGREHRVEVVFQDADGHRLAQVQAAIQVEWDESLPPGWRQAGVLPLNAGFPLPHHGIYSFEILINGDSKKSINLRVIPLPDADAGGGG
jgi:hypothetical protein